MIEVDLVHVIRHKHFKEGVAIRQIARQLRVSKNTVRRYLRLTDAPQGPRRVEREAPKKERVRVEVRQILDDWKDRTTQKQRPTGALLHKEMQRRCGSEFKVGLTLVREVFAEIRREKAEVFIPLIHRAGEEAQIDFFEAQVNIGGQRRKVWMFLMTLMFSGYSFAWLYEHCDQISFLDGHVRAFEHFGGVVRRCVYDNLSAAVKKIVGGERALTAPFRCLVDHYKFEPDFARVGEGHDKGGVEARGKGIRLAHLTPVPDAESLGEACNKLLQDLAESASVRKRGRDSCPLELLQKEERPGMLPLPAVPFDVRKTVPISISSKSTFTFDGVPYSVPSRLARLGAVAYVGPRDIIVVCHGEKIVKARQLKGGRGIEYRHYLSELAKKPKAVRQVAPELVSELGSPFQRLWQLLSDTHGAAEAARVLSRILGAVVEHGEDAVKEAIAVALESGDTSLMALNVGRQARPTIARVPAAFADIRVESAHAAAFNQLLKLARSA